MQYTSWGELRCRPRPVRSVPSARVVRSGSVIRMTPRSPMRAKGSDGDDSRARANCINRNQLQSVETRSKYCTLITSSDPRAGLATVPAEDRHLYRKIGRQGLRQYLLRLLTLLLLLLLLLLLHQHAHHLLLVDIASSLESPQQSSLSSSILSRNCREILQSEERLETIPKVHWPICLPGSR